MKDVAGPYLQEEAAAALCAQVGVTHLTQKWADKWGLAQLMGEKDSASVCIRGETAASINMPHSSDTDKNLGQGMNCQMGDQKGMKSTVHACYR